MRLVVQRVRRASVEVAGEVVGAIGPGMLILLCVLEGDGEREALRLAEKVARFRFFHDDRGRMDRSALDEGLEVLLVSQFTLAADGRKGRRPSFDRAAPPAVAEPLVERFRQHLESLGLTVACGRFGAEMEVTLVNHGPVTFVLEEPPQAP